MNVPFRLSHTYEKRYELATSILSKYPDRVPVIVYEKKGSTVHLTRNKFLSPIDVSVARFIYELRKHITGMDESKTIFVLITDKNTLVSNHISMYDVYENNRSDDMFLYMTVCEESSYG